MKRVLNYIVFWVLQQSKGPLCRGWDSTWFRGTSEGRLFFNDKVSLHRLVYCFK